MNKDLKYSVVIKKLRKMVRGHVKDTQVDGILHFLSIAGFSSPNSTCLAVYSR